MVGLGVDVPAEKFVEHTKQSKAQIVAMSALLTTTAPEQKKVIELLTKVGVRKNVKVAVGGVAASAEWAREISAEGYSDNAVRAIEIFKTLISKRECPLLVIRKTKMVQVCSACVRFMLFLSKLFATSTASFWSAP